ncbi:MAG: ABC transporter ATP-binding protein [Coriobacteriia bacterium]
MNINAAKKKHMFIRNLAWLMKTVWHYDKFSFFEMAVSAIAQALVPLIGVVTFKLVLDAITHSTGNINRLYFVIVIIGLALFVSNVIGTWSMNKLRSRFIVFRLHLIALAGKRFMGMDQEDMENPKVLDASQRADNAVQGDGNGIEGILRNITDISGKLLIVAFCSAILLRLDIIVILTLALIIAINFYVNVQNRYTEQSIFDSLATVFRKTDYLMAATKNFRFGKDIRLFGLGKWLGEKFWDVVTIDIEKSWLLRKRYIFTDILYAITTVIQEGILYAWLIYRVIYGGMSIPDFTMYTAAVRTFSSNFGNLLESVAMYIQQNLRVSDFIAFLNISDSGIDSKTTDLEVNNERDYTIEFKNVSFKYMGCDEYALRNVSIVIPPGERLAVIGMNGAGKTTFIKLLTRLYEPTEGSILLNGTDIREFAKKEYYRMFSVVFQEIMMFAFSIKENVSVQETGKIDIGRVEQAIEGAGLREKIVGLPQRYDTHVQKVLDDGGIEFSGGEKQKIALARALYKDAPIVVLDEPTSAIDALAEYEIYRNFDKLIKHKTAIYISHRLSSTRFCSKIAVFAGGQIVEYGTHQELMSTNGLYRQMFGMQAVYYSSEVAAVES